MSSPNLIGVSLANPIKVSGVKFLLPFPLSQFKHTSLTSSLSALLQVKTVIFCPLFCLLMVMYADKATMPPRRAARWWTGVQRTSCTQRPCHPLLGNNLLKYLFLSTLLLVKLPFFPIFDSRWGRNLLLCSP